jgi:hypothetical protein
LKKQEKETRKTDIFKPPKNYLKTISNNKKQERNINQK